MSELLIDNATQKSNKRLLEDTASYFDVKPDYADKSAQENDGAIYLTGILQRSNQPNQNRRIYPKKILEREVNKLLPLIKDGQVVGELDHSEKSVVEFKNVAHRLVDVWWNGDDLIGKTQVIRDHPSGQKVLALIKEGVKIGISSRGLGSTESARLYEDYSHFGDDVEVVGEDFTLICFDYVVNPSTHGAFVIQEGLMYEWNSLRNNSLPKNNYSNYDLELIEFIQKYKR